MVHNKQVRRRNLNLSSLPSVFCWHFACCWSLAHLRVMTITLNDTNVAQPGMNHSPYSLLTLKPEIRGDLAEMTCTTLELHLNPGLSGEV
ncbi:MAG: hypothetical protein FVQ84_12875 [Planctomycetes bacterium]|nr:hypothetical protein [Planctomycetota bacterium]